MHDLTRAVRAVAAGVMAAILLASPAAGQTAAHTDGSAERAKVLVLDFQTLNRSVNPEMAELARIATDAARMFRDRMQEDGRFTLVATDRFQDARSRLLSDGTACADSSCSMEAARSVGVDHVFRGRVIKVSNLIWYLVVEHEDVASGEVLGQETIELKGQRDVILPRAVAALHRWLLPAG